MKIVRDRRLDAENTFLRDSGLLLERFNARFGHKAKATFWGQILIIL